MKKQIIIGIHGFGKLRQDDFELMKKLMKEHHLEFHDFELFDGENKADWNTWIRIAYREIKSYCDDYEVILLGFSMGGVIATYLAGVLPIKKLILAAPAFYYIGFDSGYRYSKFCRAKASEGDHALQDYLRTRFLPSQYLKQFLQLVHYLRISSKRITQPILIMQGTHDEIVPLFASRYVYHQVKSKSRQRILIYQGTHEFLRDEICGREAMDLILNFI